MPKLFKGILMVWLLFVIMAVAGGGKQFRSMNDKAEWLFDALAAKADGLKEDADSLIDVFKGLTGAKKELAKNTPLN